MLLFGPQAQLAETRQVALRFDRDAVTAADVLAALRDAAPRLSDSLGTSRLAVDHEFAAADRVIAPGDEVALIGMVSGG